MNTFLKQLQRGKLFTALLAVLLAVAIAFFSISFSAWQSIMAQMTGINAQYTTIAIPSVMDQYTEQDIWEQEPLRLSGSAASIDYDSIALDAPQLLSVDRRCLLGAYVEGMQGLSTGALDPLDYLFDFDLYSYPLSVFAVKCISVTENIGEEGDLKTYTAEFEFEDAVSLSKSYDLPYLDTDLTLGNSVYNQDGSIPFEEGKTYLIRGIYCDFQVHFRPAEYSEAEGWTMERFRYDPTSEWSAFSIHFLYFYLHNMCYTVWDPDEMDLVQTGTPNFIIDSGRENINYERFPDTGLPFYAEYTGDWRDFLETPEGQVWRDEIIPMCERNQQSASVILTDSLQSIYAFNTGSATVMEGREFTPEEYVGGSRVCMVSASYAILNDLQVGDTLTLDLYNSGYAVEHTSQGNGISSTEGNVVCRLPMVEENRIGVKQDYTIVGIYSAPEFIMGVHNFHADTIFVPKASVPNAEQYEDPYSDHLNTYILENGTAEEFEAYMAENGYGGSFTYFDQDFGEIVDALEGLRSNAQRLLVLGGLAFLLAAALFLFLSLRRMAPTARGMRLMGVKPGRVWRELTAALAALIAVAAVLGGLLGGALYGVVTGKVLSGSVALRPEVLAVCAAVSAAVLVVAAAVCAVPAAGRKLMQAPGAGKKK